MITDAATLRRGLVGTHGVVHVEIRPQAGQVSVLLDPARTSLDCIRAKLIELGFPPQEKHAGTGPPPPWRNAKVLTSVTSGVLLVMGWLAGLA